VNLVLIGTDHRLQAPVAWDPKTNTWVPRPGGDRYRRLVTYCVEKLDVKAIMEETHPDQEKLCPSIASRLAKKMGVPWDTLGMGELGPEDFLGDPPPQEAVRRNVKPYLLAGIYRLDAHNLREEKMRANLKDALKQFGNVLGIVGFVHLGVLARLFEADKIPVTALLFTGPLIVDETMS
jgi:hypothetical protein